MIIYSHNKIVGYNDNVYRISYKFTYLKKKIELPVITVKN